MKNKQPSNFIPYLPLFFSMIAFLVQLILFKPCVTNDTQKFINFWDKTYPLYNWFLFIILKIIPQKQTAYWVVAILQNIFLSWSIFSLCKTFIKKAKLPSAFSFFFPFIFWVTTLLPHFLTSSGMIVPNAIMTEGLAYPLFLLFLKYAYLCLLDKNIKDWFVAALFAFLITATRGQLTWTLLLSAFLGIRCFPKGKCRKLIPILSVCAFYGISVLFACCTNYIHNNEFRPTSMGRSVTLATALYVSEPSDAYLFDDYPEEQQAFVDIMAFAEQEQITQQYEPDGLYNRFEFFSNNYDTLKDKISTFIYQDIPVEQISHAYSHMTLTLVLHHIPQILYHCSLNFLAGLVRSMAIFHAGITEITLFVYLASFIILLWMKKKQQFPKLRQFYKLSLLCALINSLFVSYGVFALSRYMFYTMAPIYIGAIAILYTLLFQRRKLCA